MLDDGWEASFTVDTQEYNGSTNLLVRCVVCPDKVRGHPFNRVLGEYGAPLPIDEIMRVAKEHYDQDH